MIIRKRKRISLLRDPINLRPEILTQSNIPKPLHGLNPRTIMGKEKWDRIRFKAQKKTDYHCIACGIHKTNAKYHPWLEGHECWKMDYESGICEVIEIVPLCHSCHQFIHSGMLHSTQHFGNVDEVKDILQHGFDILSANKLDCFSGTFELAKIYGVKTKGVRPAYINFNNSLLWDDFKLKWEGKIYNSLFNSYGEWENHYLLGGNVDIIKKEE